MSSEVRAGLVALALVVVAAAIGVAAGIRARETPPTARPVPSPTTIALPTGTVAVDPTEVQRRAFAQPLSSGCATDKAVWLFSDGGAAIRFDGRVWTIPDPTLRSLLAADCDQGTALAVGRGGALLTVDDDLRQVQVDRFGTDDLVAVDVFTVRGHTTTSYAVAVGEAGSVSQRSELGWEAIPTGMGEALRGVAFKAIVGLVRTPLAWIVGEDGVTFRLMEQGRWERVRSGTRATLRSVTLDTGGAIAIGDGGTILRYLDAEGAWKPVASGTDVTLRAVSIVGLSTAWIVGDRGTVLELSYDAVRRVDLGTACTLRAVFAQGAAIWVVGSDGVRGAAWRVTPTGTDRWGSC